MRKFLGMALVLAFMLAACDDGQAPKIGVVDLNRLMRDSAPGKAGLKYIESQQADLQSALDKIQDKLEKNPGDEAAVQELQKVYAASQQKIQAEGQGVVTRLFDSIQVALDNYRKQNGYQILIRVEALDSFDPALDVTNAIMAEVDKIKIDFKPAAENQESSGAAKKEEASQGDVNGNAEQEKPKDDAKKAPEGSKQ